MDILVNLARRPFIDLQPILRFLRGGIKVLAVIVVALGVATYVVHRKAESARSRLRELESTISDTHRERRAYLDMLRHTESVRIRKETDRLNGILDAKAFCWTQAMKDIEAVLPKGLQVTDIEPTQAKDGTTTLKMRVLGSHDKDLEFLRNLEQSSHFFLPRIVGESPDSHQETVKGQNVLNTPQNTEFDLLVDYDTAAQDSPAPTAKGGEKVPATERQVALANPPDRLHDTTRTDTSKTPVHSRIGGTR